MKLFVFSLFSKRLSVLLGVIGVIHVLPIAIFAEDTAAVATQSGTAINGNVSSSIIAPPAGGTNGVFNGGLVNTNGNVNGSNVNANSNALINGGNQNFNSVQPVLVAPSQGGSSALVLPRNPLPLPNANLGRSNFGLQFGVNNNPVLSSLGGSSNALGWFMQGGVTIPFGKIPEVYNNPDNAKLDALREEGLLGQRNVFGTLGSGSSQRVETRVEGRFVPNNTQSAYNFSTIPSAKISMPSSPIGEIKLPKSKLIALSSGEVYSKALGGGEKLGSIESGNEYVYLGHLSSGWVNVLLPNGTEGWSTASFEYVKNDCTQIDNLAFKPTVKTASVTQLSFRSSGRTIQGNRKNGQL